MGPSEAIAAIFGDDSDDGDEFFDRRPLPEAQVATLRDTFRRYTMKCPFAPGDIVTPVPGYSIFGQGHPHVVLEISGPGFTFEGESGSSGFGKRLDMRVAGFTHDGNVAAWWCESWEFEPYVAPEQPPTAAPASAAA